MWWIKFFKNLPWFARTPLSTKSWKMSLYIVGIVKKDTPEYSDNFFLNVNNFENNYYSILGKHR